MRVVHITTVHRADDVRIAVKECGSLAADGYDVTLVAPSDGAGPVEGMKLLSIPRYKGRLRRMTLGVATAGRAAWRVRADLYHLHDPELIPLGAIMRIAGKQVVFDAHEDLALQVFTKQWIPSAIRPAISFGARCLQWVSERSMNRVIAATPAIAQSYRRAVVVSNFPVLSEFPAHDVAAYASRPQAVAYVGGLTEPRGVRQMIEAMDLVGPDLDARLELAGVFSPSSLERSCQGLAGWSRVRYHGWASRSQVGSILGHVRVGLVVLQPASNYIDSYPTKLFEYMAAGIPVIASDFPLWREIVNEGGFGLAVDPTNPRAIADAITYLLEHASEAEAMGDRGRQAVSERFNWEAQGEVLLRTYREVLG